MSQILEVNPHQKYCLSDKACIGILVRANRRGKKLPAMLETALIQQTVGGTEYGQEGIADTIEILRKMRCEIGEEDLKEWVQRTFGSVQPEEVLLSEMCESDEDSEDANERIVVEEDCEKIDREEGLCDLRIGESAGDSPQRREPSEQLTEQLDLLMQKLPHENAQTPIIMYCLRIACEGEEAMYQALSAASQRKDSGADDRDGAIGCDIYNGSLSGDKAVSLNTNSNATGAGPTVAVPVTYCLEGNGSRPSHKGDGYIESDTMYTLNTIERHGVAYSIENHPADSRVDIDDSGKVQTLTSRMGTGGGNVPMVMEPAYCIGNGQVDQLGLSEKVGTLNCMHDQQAIVIDRAFFNHGQNAQYEPQYYTDGTVPTLVAKGPSAVAVRYIVRRLTPLECERLQGFPDGWTDIGEWVDTNGKKHKEADSPRYKALGNSIALPPWKWVLKRLCACYERDATMASLFDGIGGFPYIWEQLNGKGSCLWASEIEEFPIAVTKLRFGGNDNV